MVNFEKLATLCRKTVPDACMAFLGGSQIVQGGRNKVTGSDYDIVVLTPHTKYSHSFNHARIPYSKETMDIIVRDPDTLAFDLIDSTRRGHGAVPNIIAHGVSLFDDNGTARLLQQGMQEYLQQGPTALSEEEYSFGYQKIRQQMTDVTRMPGDVRYLASYELTHQAAALHLHHAGHWHASGKLLGRALLNDPPFKNKLEAVSELMRSSGKTSWALAMMPQPQDEVCAQETTSPLLSYAQLEPDAKIRDKFAVRFNADSLRDFYKTNKNKKIADDFMASKAFTLSHALNTERIGRPSNEYYYALCRVVYNLSEFNEVITSASPNGNIARRYELLVHNNPTICKDVIEAARGDPKKLKKTVENFSAALSTVYDKPSMQINPSTFRTKNENLSSLIVG